MKIATITLVLVLLTNGAGVLHADYRLRVLKDRPVAYWCFDESTGLSVGNEASGEADGRHISGAVNRRGVSGLAAAFDSVHRAGRIEVQLDEQQDRTMEQMLNDSFSLELWLLDEAATPNGKTNYSIFYKADYQSFTGNSLWLYRSRQDGRYHFRIQGQADRQLGLTIGNPAGEKKAGDRKWHHLVVTVDRSKTENRTGRLRAFLDGKPVGQSPIDSESRDRQ